MIDKSKVDTKKITKDDLHITLTNANYADGLLLPAYMVSSSYNIMTTIVIDAESDGGGDFI